MDIEKFRRLFLEEASEHLVEMSQSLLALEKDLADREALDVCFRMAHSIKGMAASLDYGAITDVAHRFEDLMDASRRAGGVAGPAGLALLFRGLQGLEAMVDRVRSTGEGPSPDPDLARALAEGAAPAVASAESTPSQETPRKKAEDRV